MNRENLLPKQGEVLFDPKFLSEEESDRYLNALLKEVEWKQEPIVIFGKKVMQPRLTAWFGDAEYRYSGTTMKPLAWTQTLAEIKARVEAAAQVQFTSVLLNQYRNERDSMGWHRDNEKELGKNPVIASLSLGESRTFKIRHYDEKSLRQSIELSNGSLLLMRGETQHHWEHAIPKTKEPKGVRINLTFRVI
jgi:alkylated DNA repair dioxygenase AlkB